MTFRNHDKDSDYDYLDDLMKDVMSDSSVESAESSPDNIVDSATQITPSINENQFTNDTNIQISSLSESIVNNNEPVKNTSRKRIPLFKKIGVDLDSTKEDKENESKIEKYDDENVNINNAEVEKSLQSISHQDDFDYKKGVELDKLHEETNGLTENSMSEEVNNLPNEDSMDSTFDNMLEELTFDDTISDIEFDFNKGKDANINIDKDVVVPLETPEMRTAKVTPDGRTLAEVLPGMRGGAKTAVEIAREIRNQETVIEVDGVKFSDDRYVKHVEVINKEVKEQNKRRELSKKFLQRNAKFTEQEKIIMSNLGVTNKQFTDLMKSTDLTLKQKEEIIGLGRYGAEKHFKGRKYRTTVGDMAMLEFLVKFKFANTRILRWISNEPQGRTWRKLNRLRDNGLVESQTLIGIPDLWAATYAGVGVTGYTYDPGLRPAPKMITISSSLGVNYIAACLWFNSVNVLNLDDFPAHNREIALQNDGRDRVRGENLVSELEIRSSLGKEINPQSTTMQAVGNDRLYDIISSNVRREFDEWVMGGKMGESPEMLLGNEYMWVLYPTSQLTLSYHVPDLVVKRERGPNGEPRSIAVEMERYDKSNDRYDKIMLAYKLDEHLYEKVVWITPNTRVARALESAARSVGFTRYTIIPIITESGTYNKQDIWLI